ncbi:MAG TPA: hypothetical protein VFE47_25425 [Tepidisphaeraceae bacterium]|nr:hypothetical protein [Tepidisphaeraceae bacterium]
MADRSAVELSNSEADELLQTKVDQGHGSATTRPVDTLRPYLVRGISYGGFCLWCRVWTDSTGDSVWVHEGTSNGENALVSMSMQEEAAPVIVFLPHKPVNVYVTCLLAGDDIFHGPPKDPPSQAK